MTNPPSGSTVEQAKAWIADHLGTRYGDRGLRLKMDDAAQIMRDFMKQAAESAQEIERILDKLDDAHNEIAAQLSRLKGEQK